MALALGLLAFCLAAPGFAAADACSEAIRPPLMFWSWQHDDDLSFIDQKNAGVSYYVGRCIVDTAAKSGAELTFDRSLNRLSAPAGVYREAALRVEVKKLDQARASATASALAALIARETLKGARRIDSVQVDFDARLSERSFYRVLLRELRRRLPSSVHLSITALASWCLGDNWLACGDLPVETVVPMFFSMGPGSRGVTTILTDRGLAPSLLSGRVAPGLSLNEPAIFSAFGERLQDFKTVYLFSSSGWNKMRFEKVKKLVEGKI